MRRFHISSPATTSVCTTLAMGNGWQPCSSLTRSSPGLPYGSIIMRYGTPPVIGLGAGSTHALEKPETCARHEHRNSQFISAGLRCSHIESLPLVQVSVPRMYTG